MQTSREAQMFIEPRLTRLTDAPQTAWGRQKSGWKATTGAFGAGGPGGDAAGAGAHGVKANTQMFP